MAGRDAGASRLVLAVLAVVALGLIAIMAGCGGGGGSASSGTSVAAEETRQAQEEGSQGEGGKEETTREEGGQEAGGTPTFIAEADEVCGAARAKMGEEFAPYLKEKGGFATLAKLAPKLSREIFIPGLEEEIAGLSELDSSGVEAQAEAIIGGFEDMVSEAKSEPKEFVFNSAGSTETERLAREYGLKVCGPLL